PGLCRRRLAPERVDQVLVGHRSVRLEQKRQQQLAGVPPGNGERLGAALHLERAENGGIKPIFDEGPPPSPSVKRGLSGGGEAGDGVSGEWPRNRREEERESVGASARLNRPLPSGVIRGHEPTRKRGY